MTVSKSTVQIQSLKERYQQVRQQTLDICAPLEREDYVVQPITDVSPPKWHLGHSTWFFENFILAAHLTGYRLFDEGLNWFFNSYYESQGPRILRSNRGNMTRPNLETVLEYREYVDFHMLKFLREAGAQKLSEVYDFIDLGLHHEQQHQELLVTDLKYILGHNPLYPVYRAEAFKPAKKVAELQFYKVREDIYEIGHEGRSFCFDNELSPHRAYLHNYQIANRLVTNGEYLAFMQSSGYEQYEHWLSEGWEWAKQLEVKAPLYWHFHEGEWYHFTLHGLQKIDPNLPVTHVSYYEADAYARWAGYRLPTEFEWEAAYKAKYGDKIVGGNFLEDGHFHPTAPAGKKDDQMLGNVWEWTGSAYLPYPKYPRLKGALGEYNGKFMINQMVLRGGSCATPRSHIRPTYRNFFHADKRWQFTGIRLAK